MASDINIIINHYRNNDTIHSLSSLLEGFLEDRKKFVRVATIDRDRTSFHRFFDGTSIINKDVREITRTELNDFCLETVIRLRLDKKGYQRLKSLLNALWDYAVNTGYSESNIARNIKPLGPAFFTPDGNLDMEEISEKYGNLNIDFPDKKGCASSKKDAPQCYSGEEQAKLISVCYQRYLELHNTAYLAIILCFCLGLRIGELVALKPEDFDFNAGVVHIRRREVSSKDETGKRCFRISERLKNGASRRDFLNLALFSPSPDLERRRTTLQWNPFLQALKGKSFIAPGIGQSENSTLQSRLIWNGTIPPDLTRTCITKLPMHMKQPIMQRYNEK